MLSVLLSVMASIHRRIGSIYYHALFTGPDGRRMYRSTKQTDRSKALATALEWQRAATLARRGELSEAQAREVVKAIMAHNDTGETLRSTTITEHFREWMAGKEARRAEGTAERYQLVVDRFLASLGKRADKPLTALTSQDVGRFLDQRLKQGVAPRTAVLDLKIVRTALNAARRQGLIPTNPAEAVDLPTVQGVERGSFTVAEVAMLADTAKGEWRTLIMLSAFMGARLGDCVTMAWGDVDLVGRALTYTQKKTGKKVTVPLHRDLLAHLETLAGTDSAQPFIMPGMSGLKSGGRHGLSEGFKRIMRKAGVDMQTVQGKGVRSISRRTFHSLRHTFISLLANAGVAEEVRMKFSGHSTKDVHRGYTHFELEKMRRDMDKLPGLNDGSASRPAP